MTLLLSMFWPIYPQTTAHEMSGTAEVIAPDTSDENRDYHNRKYRVFLRMVDDQRAYSNIMSG